MRSRPIDVLKPFPLLPTPDIDFCDQVEEDIANHSTQSIPVPPLDYDLSYRTKFNYVPFQPVNHYIKSHLTTGASLMADDAHYDLKHDDEEWLQQYNAEKKPLLTKDDLENLLDLFEVEAGKLVVRLADMTLMSSEERLDPSARIFTLAHALFLAASRLNLRHSGVESVYQYWLTRRRHKGNSLMRYFEEPPPRGNTDPHVAFRPRAEARRISKRNPRKDDATAFIKMKQLRRDFFKLVGILEQVERREKLKLEFLRAEVQIFDDSISKSLQGQQLLSAKRESLTAEQADLLSLMKSPLPPCNYDRQEAVAAEAARKKAVSSRKKATIKTLAAAKQRLAVSTKKTRRRIDSLIPNSPGTFLPESDLESIYSTDQDDDLLSETEEDILYYTEIENWIKKVSGAELQYIKQQKALMAVFGMNSEDSMTDIPHSPPKSPSQLSTHRLYFAPSLNTRTDSALYEHSLFAPRDLPRGFIGRCHGRVARGQRLFMDTCIYEGKSDRSRDNSEQVSRRSSVLAQPIAGAG